MTFCNFAQRNLRYSFFIEVFLSYVNSITGKIKRQLIFLNCRVILFYVIYIEIPIKNTVEKPVENVDNYLNSP